MKAIRVLRPEVRLDPANREVHLRQTPRRRVRLLPVNADVPDPPAVLLDEPLRLHEHPARPTTRIVNPPLVRREHLDEQSNHAARRIELPALLPLRQRELAEKILVHPPEDVLRPIFLSAEPNRRDEIHELPEPLLVELRPAVILRQNALERRVVPLDRDHCIVERLPNLGELGLVLQIRPPRLGRNPEDALAAILVRILGIRPLVDLREELPMPLVECIRNILEKHEPEHDMLVLGRVHVVPKLVRSLEQRALEPEIRAARRSAFVLLRRRPAARLAIGLRLGLDGRRDGRGGLCGSVEQGGLRGRFADDASDDRGLVAATVIEAERTAKLLQAVA